jgi:hypothetical protein
MLILVDTVKLYFHLFSFSHCLLCYNTIVINHAHIVYAPCGPLIG